MGKYIWLALLLSACATAPIKQKCQHGNKTFRCVELVRVYDGDTIFVNIPGTHQLLGKEIGVRIRGIDTPELRTKNQCEKKKGYEAKALLEKLLTGPIELRNVGRGKYFRILADIYVNGSSVSSKLIEANLAYNYRGKTKKQINWCIQKTN